jgi:hypothetical protein
MSRSSFPRVAEDASGAVLVEFALTLPILLLIIVAIFDFGLLFQKYEVVTNAAREGARMAILPGYSENEVRERIQSYLTAGGVTGTPKIEPLVPVQISPGDGGAPFTAWKVEVTLPYTFTFLGPIAGLFGKTFDSVHLHATSVMRAEVAAGGN